MKLNVLFRGLLLLLFIPVATLVVSLAALAGMFFLRISPSAIQILPRIWGRAIVRLTGVTVDFNFLEQLDRSKPYIFAANHQSQFDIFIMQGFLEHDFRWLAKKELFQIPIFGAAMRRAGYIPVDRSHGRKALKSLEQAAQRIADGTSVIIFPEGTRSADGRLQPFKAGGMLLAIKSGVPIVPVAIAGTFGILPKGKLLAKPGRVKITVGRPVHSARFTLKQKQELADILHSHVEEMLND